LASPWRGGLCTPAWEAMPSPGDRPIRPPASRQHVRNHDVPRLAPSLRSRTRRAHPSEKTTSPFVSGFSPQGHLTLAHPLGGAGSARPHARHHANPNIASFWPPASRQHVRSHDVPRLSPSLRSRTRRAHPSEKTTSRAISGPHRARRPTLGLTPLEGRALHARMGGYAFTGESPPGPPGVRSPFDDHALSRVRVRPCNPDAQSASLRENRLSRHLGASPARPSSPGHPPVEGRAPHARTQGITPTPTLPPFGLRLPANTSAVMTCPGLRPALDLGRAERIPPRKSPSALSQDFPRGHRSPDPLPAEGRAPHARVRMPWLHPGMPPLGHRAFLCPG